MICLSLTQTLKTSVAVRTSALSRFSTSRGPTDPRRVSPTSRELACLRHVWPAACVVFLPRLSSEDGEEAPAYFYESDDSADTRAKAPYSGEMDLLGEILDTLSTHSSDQGKLAAAKSLDFFRSMDDIDYKPTVSGLSKPQN